MNSYLIEFALIHIVLFVIYKLFLSKETQLNLLRIYLLGSTILALTIPLIELPNYTPIDNLDVTAVVNTIVLPAVSIESINGIQTWHEKLSILDWILISGAHIVAIRFIIALLKLIILYRNSSSDYVNGIQIMHNPNLDNSFTFFSWIFINKDHYDDIEDIVRHEEAHRKHFHSYDLLILNLLAIPFWWVPSIWVTIKELKQLHEYQADSYALKSNSGNDYIATLINNTLGQYGISLANSFNDTPLTKRLKFMKKLKKNINPWKVASMLTIVTGTLYIFSCQTQNLTDVNKHIEGQLEDEVFQVVEEPASFEGGIEEFYKYVGENLKYPQEALDKGLSGRIFVEFVVQKDGSLEEVKILRGIGAGCDEEALLVVKNSPPWTPGKQSGKIVKQRMVLPITFKHPDYVEHIEQYEKQLEQEKISESKSHPNYPGGMHAFYQYVQENISYPEKAKENSVEGKVFVEFLVNEDGSVSNVNLKRGIGSGCDEEAMRIMENSPNWEPMMVDGKPRAVTMVIPIEFRLNEKK
ncbi:MAG: M56 family metallopeptidase [Bacteroidota bacterium]